MIMRKKGLLFGLLCMLLVVSACGGTTTSVTQLLQNTVSATKQLKTVHVDMKMAATVGVTGLTSTSSNGSTTPTSFTFNITGSGDEVMPDKSSMKVSLGGLSGANYSVATIVIGNKLYIQNAKGQWYVLDKSKLAGSNGSTNPFSTISVPDLNKLLDIAQKNAKITDHGDENLNGQSLRHITVVLDKTGFQKLIAAYGQISGLTGTNQQMLNQLMNNTKDFNATLDFWIDESTSYVHRVEMKLNFNLDLKGLVTPTTTTTNNNAGVSLKLDTTIDLSKFNEPVTINAPANAIPTDNPGVIFGAGQ